MALQVRLDELGERHIARDGGIAAELGLDHVPVVGERRRLGRERTLSAADTGCVVVPQAPSVGAEPVHLAALRGGHLVLLGASRGARHHRVYARPWAASSGVLDNSSHGRRPLSEPSVYRIFPVADRPAREPDRRQLAAAGPAQHRLGVHAEEAGHCAGGQ